MDSILITQLLYPLIVAATVAALGMCYRVAASLVTRLEAIAIQLAEHDHRIKIVETIVNKRSACG